MFLLRPFSTICFFVSKVVPSLLKPGHVLIYVSRTLQKMNTTFRSGKVQWTEIMHAQ
jgi:hypothetical protein